MNQAQPKNPLHGLTLETILTRLVQHHGWERLAGFVKLHCFQKDPSLSSSLKFLRRTPWARAKVEEFYLNYQGHPWNKPGYQASDLGGRETPLAPK